MPYYQYAIIMPYIPGTKKKRDYSYRAKRQLKIYKMIPTR